MKIWAHTLVKNEEKYLWYAVSSVIKHVDKLLLWDTGSTDGSLRIAKNLKEKFSEKIDLKQVTLGGAEEFPKIRQKMLDVTDANWFIMVDGDEVWWEGSIRKVVETIETYSKEAESIVVPTVYPVGDIYHRQEEAAGKYQLAGKKGHFALRAVNRKIPGLSSSNPHGTWGWTDGEGKMIQDREPKKIVFVDAPYLHFSLLPRAGERSEDEKVIKRAQKLKHELGTPFPKDYYYPEVFFRPRPDSVPSPWERMDTKFLIRSAIETPPRKIKRRIWPGGVGY